jgi:hypothetical protein
VVYIRVSKEAGKAYLIKSSINTCNFPSMMQCTVMPTNEKTLGDVHPLTPTWSFPGYFYTNTNWNIISTEGRALPEEYQ